MIIKDKRNDEEVAFESIECGTVFTIHGGFYMKIENTYYDDNGYYENSVYLEDGSLHYYDDKNMVKVVRCELVID